MKGEEIHVYLLEPIDDKNPKKKLVYSEDPASARKASAISDDPYDRIFGDRDLSTCIQVEVKLITIKANGQQVKVEYNEIIYDLIKDKAQDILASEVLI